MQGPLKTFLWSLCVPFPNSGPPFGGDVPHGVACPGVTTVTDDKLLNDRRKRIPALREDGGENGDGIQSD